MQQPTSPPRKEGIEIAGLIYKELWHHIKNRRWSSDMGWLWTLLISWVEDHMEQTKGFIPEEDAVIVAATHSCLCHGRIPQATLAALTEKDAGRGLDVVEGGYRIHNYRKRGKLGRVRAEAGRKGGRVTQANLSSKPASNFAQANPQAIATANSGVGVGVEERIFEEWSGSVERNVRLTDGRRRVIRARLRDRFSEQDLLDAAVGWRNDPWPDRPQHNDLTILFRNGEQVEKFRDFQRKPPIKPAANNRTGQAIEAARDWASSADELRAAGL